VRNSPIILDEPGLNQINDDFSLESYTARSHYSM
jgi:hypothetical protein